MQLQRNLAVGEALNLRAAQGHAEILGDLLRQRRIAPPAEDSHVRHAADPSMHGSSATQFRIRRGPRRPACRCLPSQLATTAEMIERTVR